MHEKELPYRTGMDNKTVYDLYTHTGAGLKKF